MRLAEASERLNRISCIPFSKLFSDEDMRTIELNKGKTGQLLELALGMKLSTKNMDFDDGELKTNKCDRDGYPQETVFITQIASMIDDMLSDVPFERTRLYRKISNILYVPVCKDGPPPGWMFLPSIHIDLEYPQFSRLRDVWCKDYDSICKQFHDQLQLSPSSMLHTANGLHLQVRTKDSIPYTPIYSAVYQRVVSDKNRAFYFQKSFVYDIRKIAGR